jgi:ribosomal protein S18 acetylase RimI-like enzyme
MLENRHVASHEPLVIRPIRPEEYGEVGDLIVEAYLTLGDLWSEEYGQQLRDVAGRVAEGEVLVAEMAGRLVGSVTFADGQTALSEIDDPDAGTIRMLGVSLDARGHGIGEALVRTCIDKAKRSGRRRVRLHTRMDMASAQRLYERMGFRRDPEQDWAPVPGKVLRGYILDLEEAR